MNISNQIAITERVSSKLCWESRCKVFEFAKGSANIYFSIFIQEDWEECLGTTSILYSLRREKEIFRSGIIVGTIFGCAIFIGGFSDGIFEEEYDAIYGRELAEIIRVERDQFFELYIFDTEVIEKKCKDTL